MQAQATTDQAERIQLYQQVEQMINDAYTYIFFTHTAWMNAFTDNVHGVCDRMSPEGVAAEVRGRRTHLVPDGLDGLTEQERRQTPRIEMNYWLQRIGLAILVLLAVECADVRRHQRAR